MEHSLTQEQGPRWQRPYLLETGAEQPDCLVSQPNRLWPAPLDPTPPNPTPAHPSPPQPTPPNPSPAQPSPAQPTPAPPPPPRFAPLEHRGQSPQGGPTPSAAGSHWGPHRGGWRRPTGSATGLGGWRFWARLLEGQACGQGLPRRYLLSSSAPASGAGAMSKSQSGRPSGSSCGSPTTRSPAGNRALRALRGALWRPPCREGHERAFTHGLEGVALEQRPWGGVWCGVGQGMVWGGVGWGGGGNGDYGAGDPK